jgi:hypothetical protein
MRALYDPFTAIMAGVSAVGSIAGGVSSSNQSMDKGQYERDFYEFQARQEAIALARDLDAHQRESSAILSRSRAVSASQGMGDEDYLSAIASGYARERTTLIQDSDTKQRMLREKGAMAFKTNVNEANSAMMKGIMNALPSFGTLYKEGTKK